MLSDMSIDSHEQLLQLPSGIVVLGTDGTPCWLRLEHASDADVASAQLGAAAELRAAGWDVELSPWSTRWKSPEDEGETCVSYNSVRSAKPVPPE